MVSLGNFLICFNEIILTERVIKVVLNGHSSRDLPINDCATQRSKLGPNLFLILQLGIHSHGKNIYTSLKRTSDSQNKIKPNAYLENDLQSGCVKKLFVTFNGP